MERGDDTEGRGGAGGGASEGTAEAEALARAEHAFSVGDFAGVRRLCKPLFGAGSAEVAEAARALHRRVTVDPAQIAVVVGCVILLGAIVARYVL